jgi:predicted Na+-dependent transporter
VAQAVGLMAILAGSSAIVSPLLLEVLLPWLAGSAPVQIDLTGMVSTLTITQLLPLALGLGLGHWRPRVADKLMGPLELASKLLNLSVIALFWRGSLTCWRKSACADSSACCCCSRAPSPSAG